VLLRHEVIPKMTAELGETLAVHRRAGRRIEFLSIAWTALESIVGIIAGVIAGSIALISFGIDSVIEVASSLVLVWRLTGAAEAEGREQFAHRLVGVCFLALAIYVSFEALKALLTHSLPHVTYLGIVYAVACVIVMPLLARAKRRAAANLQSQALHADSHQSDICAYLAVILLGGLGLNALFGWWWADPLAALCMVPIILREAISGLRGQPCTHEHRV
jgi:divalent metal cation (Fe/Co/Zn/Cd) transporter